MTQREEVLRELKQTGEVSRNWALGRYISRLGAIICDLKSEGYSFSTSERCGRNGGDYFYYLNK